MNKKVLLGMSGGVDSSVSAVLLKEQGYEVIGCTLELFAGSSCCNMNTYIEAKNVCNSIGIPHIIIDCKKEFRNLIIGDFIDCYSKCLTPNPCIECNKYMKFGIMWEKAKELGCDYIATGHYAKIEYDENLQQNVLKKSNSINKDQSYVLWNMPKELLDHILFPLGGFETKDQVREIAKEYNLKVASKPDSEDICFVPDGDYKKFLENNSDIKPKEGNIVNQQGEILGQHQGLYRYTIGQRKGLGIANPVPLFVIGFNIEKNELIVGEEDKIYSSKVLVKDINLLTLDQIENPIEVLIKTRYSSRFAKGIIQQVKDDNGNYTDKILIIFDEPQARITPGQSAAFYLGDIVIGGGKIYQTYND